MQRREGFMGSSEAVVDASAAMKDSLNDFHV
jgi:hypothetical protein